MENFTYCNSLTLAGRTWRLPNINELSSIVDTTITPAPAAINNTMLPATFATYWSSSTYVPIATNAWYVDFTGGGVTNTNKSSAWSVRCVATEP